MDLLKPVDAAFTKALPKIELHAHLSGSISPQCLHEIWKVKKSREPNLDLEDPLVVMPPGKVDYTLSTFFQTFGKFTYHLCNEIETVSYATTSVLQSFFDDGIRYLELRTIPRATPQSQFTREEYLATVLEAVSSFKTKNPQMSIYLILAVDRGATTSPAQAMELVDLAIANRDNGVVGVDICGNPTKGDISLCREAFAKAKAHGLGLTVHFAEVQCPGLREELLTLLSFHPDRLGHVIYVDDDIKKEIARRRLGLELCMSCNVHAKMFDGGFVDHHFGYWRYEDCPIALCTDDVGFFCSHVSNEYLLAAEHFGLKRADILSMSRRSIEMIFGGEAEKQRMKRLLDEFESSYTN